MSLCDAVDVRTLVDRHPRIAGNELLILVLLAVASLSAVVDELALVEPLLSRSADDPKVVEIAHRRSRLALQVWIPCA